MVDASTRSSGRTERTDGGIGFGMVGFDPSADLEAGLLIGPVFDLRAAIVLGTAAFANGASACWLAGRVDGTRYPPSWPIREAQISKCS
jgi:hypothetical protein